MEEYTGMLSGTLLFKGIEEEAIKSLVREYEGTVRSYQKNSYIIRSGEKTDKLGILIKGEALIIQEDWWGNRNIISRLDEGMTFAESFAAGGIPLGVSVVASTDADALFFKAEKIIDSSDRRVLMNFIRDIAGKNIRFSEKLRHLGGRTTRAKLLSYLSREAEKAKSDEFTIPFSRQELADYLFVERSGLSMELSKMQSEGLIETKKNYFRLIKR